MIIFLYGQDSYRARQKLNEIVGQYKKIHKSGLNLRYIDFSEKNSNDFFSDFRDGMRQASMFQEKKLIIVLNSFSDTGFKEMFLKQKKDFQDLKDVIVFYQDDKIDKRDGLYKYLKKSAQCQEFEFLSGVRLRNWVKKEFEKYNTDIDQIALNKLVEYVGSDLWTLSNEINKLASFKNKEQVVVSDIELLVKSKIETDIFKTIDAIADKNKKQALQLIHKHIENGDSPLYLLSMINYQFRNLLIIKDLIQRGKPYNVIIKKSKLHPFVVKKSHYQCDKFDFLDLKKIYQKIFEVDLDVKTGKVDPNMALDLLIAEI